MQELYKNGNVQESKHSSFILRIYESFSVEKLSIQTHMKMSRIRDFKPTPHFAHFNLM